MPTKYFNLPYIDPSAPFDGATDINNLADAVDSALETVEVLGRDATFELKPATRTKLGGIIVGNGVEVGTDGTISVNVDPYELPPATHSSLGGVIIGDGINVTPDGVISIDDAAITLPPNSVGTEQIVDGAVSSPKIANKTITYEKLASSLQNVVDEATEFAKAKPADVPLSVDNSIERNIKLTRWGAIFKLETNDLTFNANGSSNYTLATTEETGLFVNNIPSGRLNTNYVSVYKEQQFISVATIEITTGTSGYKTSFNLKSKNALSEGVYKIVGNATFFIF